MACGWVGVCCIGKRGVSTAWHCWCWLARLTGCRSWPSMGGLMNGRLAFEFHDSPETTWQQYACNCPCWFKAWTAPVLTLAVVPLRDDYMRDSRPICRIQTFMATRLTWPRIKCHENQFSSCIRSKLLKGHIHVVIQTTITATVQKRSWFRFWSETSLHIKLNREHFCWVAVHVCSAFYDPVLLGCKTL